MILKRVEKGRIRNRILKYENVGTDISFPTNLLLHTNYTLFGTRFHTTVGYFGGHLPNRARGKIGKRARGQFPVFETETENLIRCPFLTFFQSDVGFVLIHGSD